MSLLSLCKSELKIAGKIQCPARKLKTPPKKSATSNNDGDDEDNNDKG